MPKSATLTTMKTALTRERRTNRRLRVLINELRQEVAGNRRDLDIQFARLAQLQVEIDRLKLDRDYLPTAATAG